MTRVQDSNGLVHLEKVLSHCLVTAGVQLFMQQSWAFGAPLFGVTQLQVALAVGDKFLCDDIRFFCGSFTPGRFRLRSKKVEWINFIYPRSQNILKYKFNLKNESYHTGHNDNISIYSLGASFLRTRSFRWLPLLCQRTNSLIGFYSITVKPLRWYFRKKDYLRESLWFYLIQLSYTQYLFTILLISLHTSHKICKNFSTV